MTKNLFDVIIIGGSYAGLAAGMTLGRALKNVLIIDNRKPCNRQTPQSHNFLTNDGKTPGEIALLAIQQVQVYKTVQLLEETAIHAGRVEKGFEIHVSNGERFQSKKLLFATGIKDLLPGIAGISESWGISVLHCPYCHGYEVRNEATGILSDGDAGFEFARLISNWTTDLTLFTNGTSTLTDNQREELAAHSIQVIEKEIEKIEHTGGHVDKIIFKDRTKTPIAAIYVQSFFEQHCKIPEALGCELTEEGYIRTDNVHETTVPGVYAIGDNASKTRTVANAVAAGASAGIVISKKIIVEEW